MTCSPKIIPTRDSSPPYLSSFLADIRDFPNLNGRGWIYRGQADVGWDLKPKAGRKEYFDLEWEEHRTSPSNGWGKDPWDLVRFREWRDQAIAYCERLPDNDFECLAYAQHYGLATRLLDWTSNPLVALYFAVEADHEKDGFVWGYLPDEYIDTLKPLESIDRVHGYQPWPIDRRILMQAGMFTFHPKPQNALTCEEPVGLSRRLAVDGGNLLKVEISANRKRPLQKELSEIGISRKSLFPDLEGLSEHVNWRTERMVSCPGGRRSS